MEVSSYLHAPSALPPRKEPPVFIGYPWRGAQLKNAEGQLYFRWPSDQHCQNNSYCSRGRHVGIEN